MVDVLSCAYALFLAVGAVMGFAKGSTASLVMGGTSAALVLLSTLRRQPGQTPLLALAVAGALAAVMGYRFSQSHKVFPAGVLAGSSACMFLYYLLSA